MGLPKNSGLDLHPRYKAGRLNLITDVEGVTVGHFSVRGVSDNVPDNSGGVRGDSSNVPDNSGNVHTGVTAVFPHQGNLFRESVMAGSSVINGFGKSTGLLQLQELGAIETPIIMTNTLAVGTALNALTKYMLEQNPDIGVTTGTVNCIVTECNDGKLNDIRGLHVTEDHVLQAMYSAGVNFDEGAVGAGSGMCSLGLKSGIGSASRLLTIDGKTYTVGTLVMSNFGAADHLIIGGVNYHTPGDVSTRQDASTHQASPDCKASPSKANIPSAQGMPTPRQDGAGCGASHDCRDQGSIIILIATDIPLSERQLNRVAKRSMVALGRTGSYVGNGSGDIAIAFTTANKVPHYSDTDILEYRSMYDTNIDPVFEAAIEAVEESIISSLYHAETVEGFMGHKYLGLQDFLAQCQ